MRKRVLVGLVVALIVSLFVGTNALAEGNDVIWVRTYDGYEGELENVYGMTTEEYVRDVYYSFPNVKQIVKVNGVFIEKTPYSEYAGDIPFSMKEGQESCWEPEEGPIIIVEDINRNTFVFEDQGPVIRHDRVLVPFRAIFEQLRCEVEWYENELLVRGKREGTVIELWINQKIAKVNGKDVELDVPAQLINDRTMVPIRFVAESLGIEVEWRENSKIVRIHEKSIWN